MNVKKTFVFIILVLLICSVATIVNADSLNDVVYDETGLLTSSQRANIEAAAKNVSEQTGAEVHVVLVNNFNGKNRDQFMGMLERETPSWQAPNGGGRKSTLLVFIIDSKLIDGDGDVGIYYGDTFKKTLDSKYMGIIDDVMWGDLVSGDYANAFIKGINEAGNIISNAKNPTPREPIEFGPVAKALGTAILILTIAGVVIAAIYYFVKQREEQRRTRAREQQARKKAEDEREAARQKAVNTSNASKREFDLMDETGFEEVLKSKVTTLSKQDPVREQELKTCLKDFQTYYKQAINAHAEAGSPHDTTLSKIVYEQIANAHDAVLVLARKAKTAADKIDEIEKAIQKDINSISNKITACETAQATAGSKVESVKGLGFTPPKNISEELDVKKLEELKNNPEKSIETFRELEGIESRYSEVVVACDTIIEQDQRLKKELPAVKQQGQAVDAHVNQIVEVCKDLDAHFAKSSWSVIANNGADADQLVVEASAIVEQAEKLYQEQNLGAAIEQLDKVYPKLAAATKLLEAVTELRDDLNELKARAPEEFKLAQIDIDKAEKYMKDNPEDLDLPKYHEALADAKSDLKIAQDEFKKELPDYNLVIDKAIEANHDADRILANCQEDHERIARLKQLAQTTLKTAADLIDQVERYIDNHRSDVGSTAKDYLSSAKSALSSARNAENPQTKLNKAKEADDYATKAYKKAQDDVNSAEAERDRQRRDDERRRRERESHSTVIINNNSGYRAPSYTPSSRPSSSPSSFGGGGGRSFGGGFGGGGGRSFSGGGGGGGGRKF